MKQVARTNLALEAASGCIFLAFVFFVGTLSIIAVNWVGSELVAAFAPQELTDEIVRTSRTFLGLALMFLTFSFVSALAIVGIRLLLVQPEPLPWEEKSIVGRRS